MWERDGRVTVEAMSLDMTNQLPKNYDNVFNFPVYYKVSKPPVCKMAYNDVRSAANCVIALTCNVLIAPVAALTPLAIGPKGVLHSPSPASYRYCANMVKHNEFIIQTFNPSGNFLKKGKGQRSMSKIKKLLLTRSFEKQ